MEEQKKTQAGRAPLAGLCSAMFLFGTIGLFVRGIPLPSSVIALVRGFVGAGFLLVLTVLRRRPVDMAAVKKNLVVLVLSGTCIGFNWILLFEAYRYTTVATATLCYYLAPVLVIFASPVILREKLTTRKVLCALTALAGMVPVSGVLENGGAALTEMKGILFGVGAAMLYASVMLLNKFLREISAFDRTILQLAIAGTVLLPYILATGAWVGISATPGQWALLAVVGVLHTGVAYAMYFSSMGALPAQTVALFSYIDPVVAILLSALLLAEPLSPMGWLGAALILGAALVSELPEKGGK